MGRLSERRILLGVTGSIAAYKAVALLRLLVGQGAQVRVVMTPAARDFVGPLSFSSLSGEPVYTQPFDSWNGQWHSHVELAQWAELFVIAPASANTMAKMAHGIADNLLLDIYLASRAAVLLSPAMDVDMWEHPATQSNLELLRQRGVRVVPVGEGFLASGLHGRGRMAEPEQIEEAVEAFFREKGPMAGRRVLLTTGPTQEPVDAVRCVTNRSSGRMGVAIADALWGMGADVISVSGPAQFTPRARTGLEVVPVRTALEMREAALAVWNECDAAVLVAAVADFRPEHALPGKLHRELDRPLVLSLVPNPDIAAELGARKKPNQRIVGFSLEEGDTKADFARARAKMERKSLDACVFNPLSEKGAGFESETNVATILHGSLEERRGLESKEALAERIATLLASMFG